MSEATEADLDGPVFEPSPDFDEVLWQLLAEGPDRARWAQLPPTGLVMDTLAAVPVQGLDADRSIEAAAAWGRLIAYAQAMQTRALARFADLRYHQDNGLLAEFAAHELAPALGISRGSAAAKLDLATALVDRLPATLAAMERGELDLTKARALHEVTANLSPADTAAVENAVLEEAATLTVTQLRNAAARAVHTIDPDGAAERHTAARTERRVTLRPATDGMTELYALLPAEQAATIWARLRALAAAAKTRDDQRTADQRRADVLTDLLLGADQPGTNPVTTQVHVTVPLTTLLGLSSAPGEVAGVGPVTADIARKLAADGTWRRLITDPLSGALLDYGTTTYRPPAHLAGHVRARDRHCRFPGCLCPATNADLDHTVPAGKGGATSHHNLCVLCRAHHRLKQLPGYTVRQDPDGTWHITTPTGREYHTKPEPLTTPIRPPAQEPDPPPF